MVGNSVVQSRSWAAASVLRHHALARRHVKELGERLQREDTIPAHCPIQDMEGALMALAGSYDRPHRPGR